jgi:hypothetical protein
MKLAGMAANITSRIALAFCRQLDYMRRNEALYGLVFHGPCWTTSRLWASRFLKIRKEKHDVDYC